MKTKEEKMKELGKELTRLLRENVNGIKDDEIAEIADKLEKLRGFALPKPRKEQKK